jgi:hypothetical protein
MDNRNPFILRLTIAGVVGLLVTAVALSTVRSGAYYIGHPQYFTRKRIKNIETAIAQYRQKTHSLPRSLKQLLTLPDAQFPIEPDGTVRDYWNHAFVYSLQGNSYHLVSYGRDGKPEGIGLDCDLSNTNPDPPEAEPTFLQLLFHPLSQGMVVTSLICGALTFWSAPHLPDSGSSQVTVTVW